MGPTPVVPTVTPVAATPAAPTPTAALVSPTPEAVELADEAVPLAAEEDKQPELEAVDEEETPLAGGKGAAWAFINFALMNLAIFESVMLLIGYFVKTKNDDEEEKRREEKTEKERHIPNYQLSGSDYLPYRIHSDRGYYSADSIC